MHWPHLMQAFWSIAWGFFGSPWIACTGQLPGAQGAALALVWVDPVGEQAGALLGGTLLIADMGLVLVAEIADRCQNGVRGRLTQTAQCAVLDTLAELFQQLHIALFALALADAVEDLQNTRRADAARRTFPAGLLGRKAQEEPGHIDHTGAVIHNDHTAGTHDGASRASGPCSR